jgi:dsDNA-binding SOS-regulon protein
MAVIVKYVVVRDGKEDMIFATKKEADAYDKMLDIAEGLYNYLHGAELGIPDDQLDALTFFVAQHRDDVGRLLKGGTLPAAAAEAAHPSTVSDGTEAAPASSEAGRDKPSRRPRAAQTKSAAA